MNAYWLLMQSRSHPGLTGGAQGTAVAETPMKFCRAWISAVVLPETLLWEADILRAFRKSTSKMPRMFLKLWPSPVRLESKEQGPLLQLEPRVRWDEISANLASPFLIKREASPDVSIKSPSSTNDCTASPRLPQATPRSSSSFLPLLQQHSLACNRNISVWCLVPLSTSHWLFRCVVTSQSEFISVQMGEITHNLPYYKFFITFLKTPHMEPHLIVLHSTIKSYITKWYINGINLS